MNIPWFMFDLDNLQLITSQFIPSDISDTKSIVFTENPIPGLNYQPMQYGGGGNRKISFTLPLIKRKSAAGNILMLKQFDNLRNQATGLFGFSSSQFQSNPKVLYNWGTGSLPQIYYVTKCDAVHKKGFINSVGVPQFSEIDFELALKEDSLLYRAEEMYRKVSSLLGMVEGVVDAVEARNGKSTW